MDWTLANWSWQQLLGALFAAAGLTIVLYLLRLKRRPVSVPFVDLFQELLLDRKASAWRSQLRRIFSLLLSLLLVGALVLAFAGPQRVGDESGRRTVVLIDAGLRTSDEQLDEARGLIQPWFSTLGPDDQMMLVEVGARPRPLTRLSSDRAALSRGLDRLEGSDAPTRFEPAVELAESVLVLPDATQGSPSPIREIIWVSSRPPEASLDAKDVVLAHQPLRRVEASPGSGNLAVSRFAARRLPRDPSRFEVLVTLESTFSVPVTVELSIHAAHPSGARSHVVEAKRLVLAPTSDTAPRRIVLNDLSSAEWGLLAELRRTDGNEVWLRDNVARTTLAANPPLDVLIVGEVDTFLEAALLLDESLSVSAVPESDYPPRGVFDLTFFNDVFVERASATGSAVYFGVPRGEEAPVEAGQAIEMFGFDSWDEESRVFAALDPYDVQVLEGTSLVPGTGPNAEADEVLGASERRPIMLQGIRAEGPFIALGFLPTNSDFVLRPAWPLFVLNLVDAMTSRARNEVQTSYRTGETWRIDVADPDVRRATVRGPLLGEEGATAAATASPNRAGSRRTVPERTVPVIDGQAVMYGDEAGFYEVRTPSGTRRFAASLPPLHEQEDVGVGSGSIEGGARYEQVTVRSAHPRSEVWFWLLLGVFGVAVVEWWSYHRRWTV